MSLRLFLAFMLLAAVVATHEWFLHEVRAGRDAVLCLQDMVLTYHNSSVITVEKILCRADIRS